MEVTSVWQISTWDLIFRMVAAVVLGGLVGLEREWNNHAAGFRTHILVCLGSATIMLLSIYGFSQFVEEENVRVDPARLAAQVISGIGFLGAGAIMRNGNIIKGLTTAASIWVVAAIGLCVGAGFLLGAALCTVLVLISLFVLNKLEKYMVRNRREHEVTVDILDVPGSLSQVSAQFGEKGIQITNLQMIPSDTDSTDPNQRTMSLHFRLKVAKLEQLDQALEKISALEMVCRLESGHISMLKGNDNGVSFPI